jgi:hypothetical protein
VSATFDLAMETRGIAIRGTATVAGAENVSAAWFDLSRKLEALGVRVSPPYGRILDAIGGLDEEAFNAVVWLVYQQCKTAGGFKDGEGWRRVREACESYPPIMEQQAGFDALARAADEAQPIVVVGVATDAEASKG